MKKNLKTPTKLKGKRKHGFRARTASAGGKKIIKRRRQKGRKRLTK
ncbi:MAG: 50S ribosomal protein L34 [Candidatus Omnitrophica bacterium]|nr:50S ribosomal protein L34 [Candidatus Omnitrophota bacterium]